MDENADQPHQYPPPTKYFDLVERIGSAGRYQWVLYLLTMAVFFEVGIVLNSPAYFFNNPAYDCRGFAPWLSEQECEEYVCERLTK